MEEVFPDVTLVLPPKLEEEAEEVCEAETHDDVVWECADLMYFLNVLMYKEGVTWKEVMQELDRRHKK